MQLTNATTFQLAMHRSVQMVGNNERRLSLDFIRYSAGQCCPPPTPHRHREGGGTLCIGCKRWVPTGSWCFWSPTHRSVVIAAIHR